MKKEHKILIFLFTITVIFLISCKSKPQTVPGEKPKPKEGQTQAADTEKAQLRNELAAIEGENGKLKKAREKAVSLGADTVYPELLAATDELAQKAKTDSENGNLKDALAKYKEAIEQYNTLSNMLENSAMREEIEQNDFKGLMPEYYTEAEELSKNAALELENTAPNYKTVKEKAERAGMLYEKILTAGYFGSAKSIRAEARKAKEKCDSIKVARSRTEEYNKAVLTYNTGKVYAEENKYKEAYNSYKTARDLFLGLYDEVFVKRQEASTAIDGATKKQRESSKLAREADKEAPLAPAAKGFEKDEKLELEDKSSPTSSKIEEIVPDEPENTPNGSAGK